MSPIIHDVEQGSPEWLALRLGIPTASEFSKILTPKTRKLSAQAEHYADRLLAEWALGQDVTDISSGALERGKELEPEARRWYEFHHDRTVETVGFCTTDDGTAGASLDGAVGEDGTIEIKCRMATNHIALLRGRGDIADMTQVQGGLWVTGRQWCDVIAYNPALPCRVDRIERDPEWMEAFDEALPQFTAKLEEAKAELLELGLMPADAQTNLDRLAALLEAGKIDPDGADEIRYLVARGQGLWAKSALDALDAS